MKHLTALFMALALIVPAHAETRVPQSSAEISLGFAPLVKEAAPAVVNIYAKRVTQTRRNPFSDDPFFRRFFEGFGDGQPRVQNSLGSGVILSRDGFVVSNYHVVGMATDVRVVLNDRREFRARVLLGDEESDLAILKLEGAQDLPHLQLRNSDTVEVGELVLAIGNPFGVGQTVSSGIVSGLARSGGTNGGGRGYFIQTDAPINPGNSGGALIDVAGRLIGINTRILTRSGGSNGIGFAIPANLVRAFVRQAEAGNDDFVRPWAGLTGQAVDNDIAEMLGLDRPGGIILSAIHPLSPFAEDFEVGDVIVSADGVPVNTPQEMMYHMAVAGEGGKLRVRRLRDGRTLGLTVRLIAAPEDPPRDTIVLGNRTVLPGLTVSRINPALTAEMRLPMESEGVVIEDAGPYGSRVGLREGDILIAVAGRQIDRPSDVRAALSQDARRYTVTALRGQRRIYLRF
ncbi:MAG: trypsin-like peptidase domain-containing protein [Pseudomonadota bacterium]